MKKNIQMKMHFESNCYYFNIDVAVVYFVNKFN